MIVTMRSSSSEVISPALYLPLVVARFTSRHSPLVQINVGFLADQVRVSSPNTLDLRQGVHDLLLSIDVRVE